MATRGQRLTRAEAIVTGWPSQALACRSIALRMPSPESNQYSSAIAATSSTAREAATMPKTRRMIEFGLAHA